MSTALTLTYFATLLGVGVLIANLFKKIRIPDTFFLLLAGLVFSPTILGLVDVGKMGDVPDFLRLLALIIIVYAGAFNMRMRTFKKVSDVAIRLAFIGVIISTVLLGFAAHYLFNLSWFASFLLGAIVCGTSSEVVLAFQDIIPNVKRTKDILVVESIVNSPLCVLIPLIIFDVLTAEVSGGTVSLSVLYLSKFWLMVTAGVGTGIIVGYGTGKIMKSTEKEFTPLLAFALALISYSLSVNVGGSGILAVATSGLIAGNTLTRKRSIQKFEDAFSVMLRISVFMLMGASVMLFPEGGLGITSLSALLFVAIGLFIARPLAVYISRLGLEELERREFLITSFIGPRGIAAAAIAPLAITNNVPGAQIIVIIVFIYIILSVLSSTIAAELISSGFSLTRAKEKIEELPEDLSGA